MFNSLYFFICRRLNIYLFYCIKCYFHLKFKLLLFRINLFIFQIVYLSIFYSSKCCIVIHLFFILLLNLILFPLIYDSYSGWSVSPLVSHFILAFLYFYPINKISFTIFSSLPSASNNFSSLSNNICLCFSFLD